MKNTKTKLSAVHRAKDRMRVGFIPEPPPNFLCTRPVEGFFHMHNLPVGQRVIAMYVKNENGTIDSVGLPKFLEALAQIRPLTDMQKDAYREAAPEKAREWTQQFEDAISAFKAVEPQQAMQILSEIVIGVFAFRNDINQIKG